MIGYHENPTQLIAPNAEYPPDFSELLTNEGFEYQAEGFTYTVGVPINKMGWILHITIILPQIWEMLKSTLPILKRNKVAFKLIANVKAAKKIQYGDGGLDLIGKIITIYPDSNELALELAIQLIEATKSFRGPSVQTDYLLGGTVYTRYGIFTPSYTYNSEGVRVRAMLKENGKIEIDPYEIPFMIPKGIPWPFNSIKELTPIKIQENTIGQYSIIKTISSSPKGAVYLAKENRNTNKNIILKRGVRNMWTDESGRDMTDRIKWQCEIHNQLMDKIGLPTLLERFEHDGDCIMAMEAINGIPLSEAKNVINPSNSSWFSLSSQQQFHLLNLALQITITIETFHSNGFLHRDLTPSNFLVEQDGRVRPIDVEMAYNYRAKDPTPPFQFGTRGYTPPLSEQQIAPTIQDDIYGIGALLIFLLAGISPLMIETNSKERCHDTLMLFTQDDSISSLISSCLSNTHNNKPCIKDIKNNIIKWIDNIRTEKNNLVKTIYGINSSEIINVIKQSINALSNTPTEIADGMWLSVESNISDRKSPLKHSYDFDNGLPGIIYTLSKLKSAGYDTSSCNDTLVRSTTYLDNKYLPFYPRLKPGLFNGASGVALANLNAIKSGIKPYNIQEVPLLKKCLTLIPKDITLWNGLSGIGLAVIESKNFFSDVEYKNILSDITNTILTQKIESGIWVQMETNSGLKRFSTSFRYGNAGILFFLVKSYTELNDEKIKREITISLKLLQAEVNNILKEIELIGIGKYLSDGLSTDGIIGSAIALLSGFELTKNVDYLTTVQSLLITRPTYEIFNNLGISSGASMLGIIYQELFIATNNQEWLERALWISEHIIKTRKKSLSGEYWTFNDNERPQAGILNGTCGIILFLKQHEEFLTKIIQQEIYNV